MLKLWQNAVANKCVGNCSTRSSLPLCTRWSDRKCCRCRLWHCCTRCPWIGQRCCRMGNLMVAGRVRSCRLEVPLQIAMLYYLFTEANNGTTKHYASREGLIRLLKVYALLKMVTYLVWEGSRTTAWRISPLVESYKCSPRVQCVSYWNKFNQYDFRKKRYNSHNKSL